LSWLGTRQRASGDLDGATALLEESLRLYRIVGAVGGIAYVLLHLGRDARARQDAVRAQALFEQSLALYESVGDRSDVAYATAALASLAADDGEVLRARSLCAESIATFRQLGDIRGVTEGLRLLGRIATLQGDDAAAVSAYADCLHLSDAMRKVDVAYSIEGLAMAIARIAARAQQTDQMTTAVHLLGAAAALREALGPVPEMNWGVAHAESTHADYARQVLAARSAFGETEFDTAWAVGRHLSVEQAIAEAPATSTFLG
jgi:tetratricopeptide (TPR) repeat protein